MTDSSKTPSSGGRSTNKTSGRKGEQQNQAAVVAQRRLTARKQAELRRQRRIIAVAGGAIGLAVLAVLIGLLYDQLWIPSRPVAKVGTVTLSRGDYWHERRLAFAREIAQNFQLLALFGSNQQFSAQFQNRSPAINQQLQAIRSTPVDDAVVTEWLNRQFKQQGAANLGIQVSEDEVNQQLVNDLSQIFLPPPPVTATQTLTPTEVATPAPQATATLTPTEAPTVTPGGPTLTPTVTATPEPTFTPPPTETPLPTVVAAVAAQQVPEIIDQIFRRYEVELLASDLEPELTKEEFRAALEDQYREQLLNTRIQERLVPEDGFVESTEPEQVSARQILVAVTPPEGATQEQLDQLFATAKARADELAQQAQASGADFAALAAANSDDPGSRDQGGDLGSFDRNGVADNGATYPPELVGAAYELPLDAVSDPIRSQFGWHIIQVTDRQVPDRETQLREARTEALDTWVEEQRTALGVQRFPEPTATPSPLPETSEPTATPMYQPGPPTVVPTEPPAPTVTPAADTSPEAPTPGVEVTSTP